MEGYEQIRQVCAYWVFAVVAYGVMVRGLGMMNRPSDAALYAGMAVIVALVAAGPLVVRQIWRW